MKDFDVIAIPNGRWKQNCYLVVGRDRKSLIIDPGSDPDTIARTLEHLRAIPCALLITHAHYDHIGAASALIDRYSLPFYLHNADQKLLKQANIYKLLFESRTNIRIPDFSQDLAELSTEASLSEFKVQAIHTPGHTAGSVCLRIGDALFSGDTLLPKGPGRTDLPGGNREELKGSLIKLRDLDPDLTVYPGHGSSFSLRHFFTIDHGF